MSNMAQLRWHSARYAETSIKPFRMLRANILLSSFQGRSTDIYRAVHRLSDNDFFFADYAKEFFLRVHTLLASQKIVVVRRLLVFEDESELASSASKRIIAFHSSQAGYEARLLHAEEFATMLRVGKFPATIDFGIFGERRVYRAQSDRPDFVIGTWSAGKAEVQRYLGLFERCWGMARKCTTDVPIGVDGLFSNCGG